MEEREGKIKKFWKELKDRGKMDRWENYQWKRERGEEKEILERMES